MQIRPLLSLALATSIGCGGEDTSLPIIEAFSVEPTTVDRRQTVSLSWQVTGANTLTINAVPGETIVPPTMKLSGTAESPALMESTTFVLRAVNKGGSVTAEASVVVEGVPYIDAFVVSPTTIDFGQTATLTWSTSDTTQVEIVQTGGPVIVAGGAPVGQVAVTPATTTKYVLTASDDQGKSTPAEVTVVVNDIQPTIEQFTAFPNEVNEGELVTLDWIATGALNVAITNRSNEMVYRGSDSVGSQIVLPSPPDEIYLLTVSNPFGTVTATVGVTVHPILRPRIISFLANPSTVNVNEPADLTWVVENTDVISIADGKGNVQTATRSTGLFTVTPTVSTTYVLTATSATGTATASATVTVNPNAPEILDFVATPNPAPLFGNTTLSWVTSGATALRIKRGGMTVYQTQTELDSGSLEVPLTTTSTVFLLEVENVGGINSFGVVLFGHEAPVIRALDVTPLTFTGSTTVTVSWDVVSVSGLVLFANGTPLPGFPTVSTTTAAIDVTSAMQVAVNETTRFTLMAQSAKGSVTSSALVAQTVSEVEPNDSSSTAQTLVGDGSGVTGTLHATDVDWFAVQVPAGGSVRAETSDGNGGCNADTQLTLTDATTTLASDDNDGVNTCSLIDPRVDAGAANLAAGTYLIFVASNAVSSYVLTVLVSAPDCGNEILESGEQCDDGNRIDGDGCTAHCQVEPAGSVSGPPVSTQFMGSLDVGQRDFFRVDMLTDGYIRAETFTPSAPTCNTDTQLFLLDTSFNELGMDDFDGVGLCSRIDPDADAFAAVPAGIYWLAVAHAANDSIAQYELTIETFGRFCGNGIREVTEQCDDGNITPGDGCDAVCSVEGTLEDETAGNDAHTDPGVISTLTGGRFVGAIDPSNDRDFYTLLVPQGNHVFAEVSIGSVGACPAGGPRARLSLYDTDGVRVLFSDADDGPEGNCGRVAPDTTASAFSMASGAYYLMVDEVGGDEIVGTYILDILIVGPGCGNNVRESGESCDDGNLTPHDGCDQNCQIEPVGSVLLPDDAPAVRAGALVPAGSEDLWQIDVNFAGNVLLTVESFTPNVASGCQDDTQLRLYDGSLTEIAFSDDIQPPTNRCSRIENISLSGGDVYFLSVREAGDDDEISAYELLFTVGSFCGNSAVEPGEQCDDGNTSPNDGCDPSCQYEVEAPITGTETRTTSLSPGTFVLYPITITAGGQSISAVSAGVGGGFCSVDTDLTLTDDAFTVLGQKLLGGPYPCAAITYPADTFAVDLVIGTYHLFVENSGQLTGQTETAVTVHDAQCGNTVIERNANETCDDGNTSSGDGCAADCTWEGIPEQEPNDTAPLATDSTLADTGTVTISGRIDPSGDLDYFRFEVITGPRTLVARTHTLFGDPLSCDNNLTDTWIFLEDDSGNVLTDNDDINTINPFVWCSEIDGNTDAAAANLAPGFYRIRVQSSYFRPSGTPSYFLDISLQ